MTANDNTDMFCPANYYEAAFEFKASGAMARIAKEAAEEKAAEAAAKAEAEAKAAEAPKAEAGKVDSLFDLLWNA